MSGVHARVAGQCAIGPAVGHQTGAVLLLVLILLTVFLLALSAMVGSSVNNLASVGNFVYHEGAVAVTDSVVADAKAFLRNPANDLGVAIRGQYSPLVLPDTNGDGVPASPCPLGTGWLCVPSDSSTYPGYAVQYFIERLCTAAGAVTLASAPAQCQVARPGAAASATSVNDLRATITTLQTVSVLYRVTVKATGPRNTSVLTQTVISKSV